MAGEREKWINWTAAAAFGAVLTFALIWGQQKRGMQGMEDSGNRWNTQMSSGPEDEEIREDELLQADPAQKKLLGQLMECLEKGDMEEAAHLADREEEKLEHLFYEVMKGERYLYDGEKFFQDQTGKGLVLTMAKTMFFGTFQQGKPEGEAIAFQVVELEEPRYEYAQGTWKDGRLEGMGNTGYCYYGKVPQGEPRSADRKGNFVGDRMEGNVEYLTESMAGQKSSWEFKVKSGVIQLDSQWVYVPEQGEYRLMSKEDEDHAYILEESMAGQSMWVNPLLWEG